MERWISFAAYLLMIFGAMYLLGRVARKDWYPPRFALGLALGVTLVVGSISGIGVWEATYGLNRGVPD